MKEHIEEMIGETAYRALERNSPSLARLLDRLIGDGCPTTRITAICTSSGASEFMTSLIGSACDYLTNHRSKYNEKSVYIL